MPHKVFISHFKGKEELFNRMDSIFQWLGCGDFIKGNSTIFVKPNLTYPTPMPGVTTTPEFLHTLVKILRMKTSRIFIGESDGGYHSHKAEEAFRGHGLYELGKNYDVKLINLSNVPSEWIASRINSKEIRVRLPSFLVHEVDVFITAPVPKIHAMTGVSLAFKNQWGCVPDTMRLLDHFQFSERIVAINKLLKPKIALFDGTYFLDKNGPLAGDPVRMNLIIGSNHIGAGDLACCRLMGINPGRIKHLKMAQSEGLFPSPNEVIEFNQPIDGFRTHGFRLERNLINWIALSAFNSSFGTKLLYNSRIGDLLHKLLHVFKKNSLFKNVFYKKCIY